MNLRILFRCFLIFTSFLISFYSLGQKSPNNQEKIISEIKQNQNIKTASDFTELSYYQEFTKISADSIILLITRAEEISTVSEKMLDKEQHGNLLRSIGKVFYYKSINEYAIKYFELALNIFNQLDNKKEIARTLSNIAVMNEIVGNYSRALELHYKALETLKALGDKKGVSFVLNNIAVTYVEMNNYSKALNLYKQSLSIKEELADTAGMASSYNNIGVLFGEKLHNSDSMNYYLAKALRFYKLLGDSINYATSLNNLSEIFLNLGQYQSAKDNSLKALKIFENKSYKKGLAYCNRNLAHAELKLGNYSLAENYLAKSEAIIDELEDVTKKLEILQLRQELYIKNGKKDLALQNFTKYTKLKDSIENRELSEAIANSETKYKVFEKENEIILLETENKIRNQQIILFITISVSLLLLLILGLTFYIKAKKRAQQQKEQLKLQLFRSQMNPHFIFNALASIQNFLYKNEAKKAAGYLGNFSSLTRSILINSTEEVVSLEEEIETIKNYIELEKMRMNGSFEYKLNFDEELETEFIKIPPMLIQPFVENAIKHGLKSKEKDGLLTISFTDNKDILKVQVVDNGVGINSTVNTNEKEHQSMALSIFNQRMKIIGKKEKKLPLPKIEDLSLKGQQGTIVEFYLPILE